MTALAVATLGSLPSASAQGIAAGAPQVSTVRADTTPDPTATADPTASSAPTSPSAPTASSDPTPTETPTSTPTTTPSPQGPLRLMAAGDSITHEFTGDYTWRYRLWQEFQRQRVPVALVGPRTGSYGPIPFWIVPSWRAWDHHDALGGSQLHGQKVSIGNDVANARPDVMLVMTGFNDLNHGRDVPSVVADMTSYLTDVFAAAPQVRVVLSPVLHTLEYPGGTGRPIDAPGGAIDQLNAGYATVVAQFAARGRDIRMVDPTTAAWQPRSGTTDGVHPTPTGETVLAQRYAAALFDMGVLRSRPHLQSAYVPWITGAKAVVTQSGRRTRFGWDAYQPRLTMRTGVVKIEGGRLRRPLVLRSATRATSVTTRLPRGRYRVLLSPERNWLVGRWGPSVSFRVR